MELHISIGGPPGESVALYTLPTGLLCYEYHPGTHDDSDIELAVFTAGRQELHRFRSVVERLCADWRHEYRPDLAVNDGTRWSVDIRDRHLHITSSGSNAFPANWERFLRAASRLAGGRWIG